MFGKEEKKRRLASVGFSDKVYTRTNVSRSISTASCRFARRNANTRAITPSKPRCSMDPLEAAILRVCR